MHINSFTVSKVCAFYGLEYCGKGPNVQHKDKYSHSLSASHSLPVFLSCVIICPLKELQVCAEHGDNYCLQFDFYAT